MLPLERPPFRRLRAYAFDPSLSNDLDNAVINLVTIKTPWEFDRKTGEDNLQPGPIGEYVEVIDFDPASACCYAPVDLNKPYLLAQDGLEPSEGNPQFHQQFVYAVSMTTIRNFERALGRTALWSSRISTTKDDKGRTVYHEEFVRRLRIYPHALREANAYYSPDKKALLFGYFPATVEDVREHLPGGMVFACLSHDVVAHETTHALLDGMHRRFNEASNPDSLAFHEAFADIVALFQHFSFPEVLRHQLAQTRGDLGQDNLLAQLAQEFGRATGAHGSLRDALGTPAKPEDMLTTTEPHARGSLLVAAVFDAFVAIYKRRTADLLRIATGGSGVLPTGALHPDLVKRLANEASKSAQHVLFMCIRALDYCPPVDLTFGDYLRALITADYDLVPDDDLGYRLAMVEAFRRRGIYPLDVRSLSVDSLRWSKPSDEDFEPLFLQIIKELGAEVAQWDLRSERSTLYDTLRYQRGKLHNQLAVRLDKKREMLRGLMLDVDQPHFEVHSLRPVRRVGPDGELLVDLVIELTQRRRGYFDPAKQQGKADYHFEDPDPQPGDFIFRGGATLIVDLADFQIRYSISKDITSEDRLARQRAFLAEDSGASLRALYFEGLAGKDHAEPFALLHRSAEQEDSAWLH